MVLRTGLCRTTTGLGLGQGADPASSALPDTAQAGSSAPALHCPPAGLRGGGEGQWQCLVTASELRLASPFCSLSAWLEGYLLGGSVHTAGWRGKSCKWKKIYSCSCFDKANFFSFTNCLKTQCNFLWVLCQIGVLNSCDIHVVILRRRVLCSVLKSNFVFLRGSTISNKPLMLFCLRRVYKIKMHCAMNHVDIEFQYSALFLSERLLHKIVLFFKKSP